VLDGCEMHRDTLRWILEAAGEDGGWGMVQLQCFHGWWDTFPRVVGRCLKVRRKCTCEDCGGEVDGEESSENGESESESEEVEQFEDETLEEDTVTKSTQI